MGRRVGLAIVALGAALCVPAGAGAATASVEATVNLGGLLPLPSGPTCSICANFVTTHDADGNAGPLAPTTRMHRDLLPNAAYALDVDTNLPPVPLGLLPIPGYELRATVEALDASRPTVRLARLGVVPAQLPLRVEVVTGDLTSESAPKTTFGYDALDATAPRSFVAALDLTDRDANASTTNTLATMTIDTVARRLTVLTEGFTGAPDGERTNRHIRRLTYRGDPTKGTAVPKRAAIDVTSSVASQRVILTRDLRTTLDVEVVEAVLGRRLTGTLDELSARADLTVADEEGAVDKRATYLASGVVQNAVLQMDEGDTSSRASVTRLPSDVKLTYASLDNGTEETGDDGTAVTYLSNGRATDAELRRSDGPRVMTASMDNVPANITDLRYVPSVDGAHVVYTADGRATEGTVEVTDGSTTPNAKRTKATLVNLPASMDLTWSSKAGSGFAHYFSPAGHVADQAKLELDDEKGQKTTIDLVEFPATMNVDYAKSAQLLDFDYSASSEVPSAEIHGTNFQGLPDQARDLHLSLKGVPTGLGLLVTKASTSSSETNELPPPELCSHVPEEEIEEHPERYPHCPQNPDYTPLTETIFRSTSDNDLEVTTPGGRLASGEIQLTSGPDEPLPETAEKGNPLDGVRIHDTPDDFVAFARVSQFDQLTLKRHGEGSRRVGPGINPPPHSATTMDATLDTLAEDHALDIQIISEGENAAGQATMSSTDAQLVTLPAHVNLHTETNSTFGTNKTVWNASRPVDGWLTSEIDGERRPAFVFTKRSKIGDDPAVITEQATLDPMPKNFSVCQIARLNTCSEGRFDLNLARLRDADIPYRTFACAAGGCDTHSFPIVVDHAGNGSFLLKADTPTDFTYKSGDWFDQADPFTTVDFKDLVTFGLQGNKENYPCSFGSLTNDCKKGHVAMDTGGHFLEGRIEQRGENSFTRLVFPPGFRARRLVWTFNKTGAVSGRLATVGALDCPDGTQVTLGNETINERFCDGDLLEGTILDQF